MLKVANTCTLVPEICFSIINKVVSLLYKLGENFFQVWLLLLRLEIGGWFFHISVVTPWEVRMILSSLVEIIGAGIVLTLIIGHIVHLFGWICFIWASILTLEAPMVTYTIFTDYIRNDSNIHFLKIATWATKLLKTSISWTSIFLFRAFLSVDFKKLLLAITFISWYPFSGVLLIKAHLFAASTMVWVLGWKLL